MERPGRVEYRDPSSVWRARAYWAFSGGMIVLCLPLVVLGVFSYVRFPGFQSLLVLALAVGATIFIVLVMTATARSIGPTIVYANGIGLPFTRVTLRLHRDSRFLPFSDIDWFHAADAHPKVAITIGLKDGTVRRLATRDLSDPGPVIAALRSVARTVPLDPESMKASEKIERIPGGFAGLWDRTTAFRVRVDDIATVTFVVGAITFIVVILATRFDGRALLLSLLGVVGVAAVAFIVAWKRTRGITVARLFLANAKSEILFEMIDQLFRDAGLMAIGRTTQVPGFTSWRTYDLPTLGGRILLQHSPASEHSSACWTAELTYSGDREAAAFELQQSFGRLALLEGLVRPDSFQVKKALGGKPSIAEILAGP